MQNQKLDNQLNLALETPVEERSLSGSLDTGFDAQTGSWELIAKYSGSLDEVRRLGVQVEPLLGGYAILTAPQELIGAISALPQIAYLEAPRQLTFSSVQARTASCITGLERWPFNLTGRGVFAAVADSGVDYFHEAFRKADGTTRIFRLWDQTLGRVFDREQINQALEAGSRSEARQIVPSQDVSGHGTAVAGIMAGSRNGEASGIAPECELLVAKLGNTEGEIPQTAELMRAVNRFARTAAGEGKPLAVNISIGTTNGSHSGDSLLETFLDEAAGYGKSVITVGSGNEGSASGHVEGILESYGQPGRAELSVSPYEPSFGVRLWKDYEDQVEIRLQTPDGQMLGPFPEQAGRQVYTLGRMQLLVYYGGPAPYSQEQEILFEFVAERGGYVESGIWTFLVQPGRVRRGRYDFWLPAFESLGAATRFFSPSPETTLTIPSCARKVLTVGAYDSIRRSYADFSGRGYLRNGLLKPDIAAPGVGLLAPAAGGGYATVTGTSFAAPVAAGSCALLMQWGIVDGNDPFLYGEKLKAYLRRGARVLPGMGEEPNPMVGFGALCVRESIP